MSGLDLSADLVYLLRIFLAAVCGALIGLEREKRQKSAGLRTHIIVSLASALMMIVSKYGFMDVIWMDGLSVDASRIAAGVVTAIGFIGGGVIFIRKDNAVGLTTAAGLWATVGVGVALGAGMYFLGVAATLMMLLIQMVMHWKKLKVVSSACGTITVNLTKHHISLKNLKEMLEPDGIFIRNMSITRNENDELIVKASIMLSKREPLSNVVDSMDHLSFIDSMEIYTIN